MFITKKIIIFLVFPILLLGFSQVAFAVDKNIGETATINISCSDSDSNLSQCNITSPCSQTCPASGSSGNCSCEFTCVTKGTYDACGLARDSQGEIDSKCLDIVVCNNRSPVAIPVIDEMWNNCTFQELSLPIFNWTYSDIELDPQQAYEIRIDNDSDFTVQDPEEITASGGSSVAYTPLPADWRDWANWNTSYYWIVRVQDNQDNWSDWSNSNIFRMPNHAYPWPDFTWTPEEPVEGEIVIFNPDSTQVYGGSSISSYLWTTDDKVKYKEKTSSNSQYPNILFSEIENPISLQITDSSGYSCESSESIMSVTLPLPEYKEVPAVGWIQKIFSIIINLFKI